MSGARAPAVLAALAVALCVGGCGLLEGRSSVGEPSVARAERTHELSTPAPPSRVSGGWRTPVAAVTSFATVYVNWTSTTVAARLRALAVASIGPARAELATEAAQVGSDDELRAGEIANSGTVEAVASLAGRGDRYVVVTRERTTSAVPDADRGLAPEWHVSMATVARVGDGLWVLSGWQPES